MANYTHRLVLNDRSYDLLSFANRSRNSGLLTDVDIEVGNRRFSCHKMVLSCYSDYFRTMFQQETQERHQNTVQLVGLEEEQVKFLINFMYGELVQIDEGNVFQILAVADYLLISEMKTNCFHYLEQIINVENCMNVLSASRMFMSTLSTDWIYEFICENFAAVIGQDKFKHLSVSDLTFLVEQLNKKETNCEVLYTAIVDWVASDREERKFDFASLFQLIDLSKLSREYLREIVSKEPLIKQSANCLNALVTELSANPKTIHTQRHLSKILILGGNPKYSVMAIKYIPETNIVDQYTVYSRLPMNLVGQSSNKVKNLMFCIGGTVEGWLSNYCTSKVFQMDLTNENLEWKEASHMNERRSDHSSALFGDNIIVSGGQRSNAPLKSVECYSADANKWTEIKAMKFCRSGHATVVCDNRLYALGGESRQSLLSSVETLSHVNEVWKTGLSMNKARCQFAAVSFNGEIYAIGGQSENGIEKTVEKFSPVQRKWSFIKNLNKARKGHAAGVFRGKIFVIGGRCENNEKDKVTFETYEPRTDTWRLKELGSFSVEKLYRHSLVVV